MGKKKKGAEEVLTNRLIVLGSLSLARKHGFGDILFPGGAESDKHRKQGRRRRKSESKTRGAKEGRMRRRWRPVCANTAERTRDERVEQM